MNLVDPILFQSRYQPAVPALLTPGACLNLVNYDHLGLIINNVASRARSVGLERGHTVVLSMRDQLLHVSLILGLTKIGVVTLTATNFPSSLRVDAVMSDHGLSPGQGLRTIPVDPEWLRGDAPALEPDDARCDNDICRLVLTSGTTGESKAAAFTHARIAFRSMRHQTIFGHGFAERSRLLLDMGLSTSMAYMTLFYMLSRGGTVAFRGSNPAETLQAFLNFGIDAIVGSPMTLAELVEMQARLPQLIAPFRAIVSIGSVLTPALADRVRACLGTNLISAYGSTEAGVVATAPAGVISRREGAVGYITSDVKIDVLDDAGRMLPAGETGRLRIRSEVSANGLLDSANKLAPFSPDGYFPGDLGAVARDGMLVLSGRENAVINIGGNKISPERIEETLASFPLLRDVGAFAVLPPTGIREIGIAIVWQKDVDLQEARSKLQQFLQANLSRTYVPKIFVQIDQIPRNENGKIDRDRLQRIAEESVKRMQPNVRATS